MQSDNFELQPFIEASKSKGASDEFLATLLTRRGWPADDVYAALAAYWQQATGLEIPERTSRGESSRDAFLYLLSFATLATWASALGSMLFRLIDLWFPDPVAANYMTFNLRQAITWQMASITVAFPIFVLVVWIILREAQQRPERLQSAVRKWLTYIALLLTAGGMIADLICFFGYFLNGELTSRFVLKSLTVMIICGAIFLYYIASLRWDRNTNVVAAKRRSFRFGIATAAVLVTAFSIGLGVAGTPSQQRRFEADRKRVEDLQSIATSIYSRHEMSRTIKTVPPLPSSLSDVEIITAGRSDIRDPETQKLYIYRRLSGTQYQLCATFANPTERDTYQPNAFWSHGNGQTCFTLDASRGAGFQR